MAEEKESPVEQLIGEFSDDMSAMRTVLRSVRGSSPISVAPIVDPILVDDNDYGEQYQFET